MKPCVLKPGDTIAIAAPSSPFDREEFLKGVLVLQNMGFKVIYRDDIFEKNFYLAGSDERRIDELFDNLANTAVKALLFARGGYGLLRILPQIDYRSLQTKPKIILGYSDITLLLIHLYQKYGWITFYGPVVAKDLSINLNEATQKSLYAALTNSQKPELLISRQAHTIKSGQTEGVLVGGCLSLVCSSLGTSYEINTDDKILFLEDTNEKPYAVDRLLTQLVLANKLKKVRGIVFGNFVNGADTLAYLEAFKNALHHFKGPIVYNFPIGHGETKLTIPLGVKVSLDADKKCLEFLEAPCLEK